MSFLSGAAEWLNQGYLEHEKLSQLVRQWASEYPQFLRLTSLAKSLEGRDTWLLEIGPEPDRIRPAIWIDAGMHAAELLGTNVALHIARSLLELHSQPQAYPRREHDAARQALFYVMPRMSPDGAEAVLATGKVTRSAPRDRRKMEATPHWVRSDIDGNGRILQMRKQHPAGDFVCHPRLPHVLVRRELGDEGPFYKVFPEGYVKNFDGSSVPYPTTNSDNDSDFNRSFLSRDQSGGMPSEDPETGAVADFALKAPHIFCWLNLHTFGGVFIRPPFERPDTGMNPVDLGRYGLLATLMERTTGFPTISAFQEMTPRPDRPMMGTLASWAYEERGCFAWAAELWDLFEAVGLTKKVPFFRNYEIVDRHEIEKVVAWDTRDNGARAFTTWKSYEHPQLGDVEIGGIDSIRGLINPPEAFIASQGEPVARLAIALASVVPCIDVSYEVERIASGMHRVVLSAVNRGWLSTSGTHASRSKAWNRGLRATLRTKSGCRLLHGVASVDVEHLPGWGEQADPDDGGPFFQRSAGVTDMRVSWLVSEQGELELEFGSDRLGWRSSSVTLPREGSGAFRGKLL